MSTPRHGRDIDILIEMGFTHLLTLTEESPLHPSLLYMKPIRHIYVPLKNYEAPTLAEMDVILAHIRNDGVWLVHCGGGVGRTGTVLACCLAVLGSNHEQDSKPQSEPQLDARTAISLLRHMRPKSLESRQQEQFVTKYVSHRWKTLHEVLQLDEPSAKLEIMSTGASVGATTATVLIMVGRPGSGKSWLASAIAKRRRNTIVINQDEGGRAACERQWGRAQSSDMLIILDRCNPSKKERKRWLRLLPDDRRCIALYFDYDPILCQQRMNRRLDHPTIRAGCGENALCQKGREMEAPSFKEGFHQIFVISSFAAAKEALRTLTPTLPLLKFPRTPHLLHTEAVTKDDIVHNDFSILEGQLTLEEKIDGANVGFSLDIYGAIQCQNRSHWVHANDHAQFKPLNGWLEKHRSELIQVLARDANFLERHILYGEWVVAKHSVHYTSLPDYFLAFDLYDRLTNEFVSRSVFTSALRGTRIRQVPLISKVSWITRTEILQMIQKQSSYANGKQEGIYVRFEDKARLKTIGRGKIVRADFIAGDEHWARGPLVLNGIIVREGTKK